MSEPTIVNYIEISGENFLLDDLPEEKLKKVKEILQERAIGPLGFKRKSA